MIGSLLHRRSILLGFALPLGWLGWWIAIHPGRSEWSHGWFFKEGMCYLVGNGYDVPPDRLPAAIVDFPRQHIRRLTNGFTPNRPDRGDQRLACIGWQPLALPNRPPGAPTPWRLTWYDPDDYRAISSRDIEVPGTIYDVWQDRYVMAIDFQGLVTVYDLQSGRVSGLPTREGERLGPVMLWEIVSGQLIVVSVRQNVGQFPRTGLCVFSFDGEFHERWELECPPALFPPIFGVSGGKLVYWNRQGELVVRSLHDGEEVTLPCRLNDGTIDTPWIDVAATDGLLYVGGPVQFRSIDAWGNRLLATLADETVYAVHYDPRFPWGVASNRKDFLLVDWTSGTTLARLAPSSGEARSLFQISDDGQRLWMVQYSNDFRAYTFELPGGKLLQVMRPNRVLDISLILFSVAFIVWSWAWMCASTRLGSRMWVDMLIPTVFVLTLLTLRLIWTDLASATYRAPYAIALGILAAWLAVLTVWFTSTAQWIAWRVSMLLLVVSGAMGWALQWAPPQAPYFIELAMASSGVVATACLLTLLLSWMGWTLQGSAVAGTPFDTLRGNQLRLIELLLVIVAVALAASVALRIEWQAAWTHPDWRGRPPEYALGLLLGLVGWTAGISLPTWRWSLITWALLGLVVVAAYAGMTWPLWERWYSGTTKPLDGRFFWRGAWCVGTSSITSILLWSAVRARGYRWERRCR